MTSIFVLASVLITGCGEPASPASMAGLAGMSPAHVEVTPHELVIAVGDSGRLTLEAITSSGGSLERSSTWRVGDDAVASLRGSGSSRTVEALSAGTTVVIGSVDGVTDTADVRAVKPVFDDGFESGGLGHTENGYQWGNAVNGTVVADAARTGSHGLRLTHPSKADGDDSVAQINLHFGDQVSEVWVEYWMKVPENYYHRDSSGPDNNKFFQVWGGSRSNPDVGIIAENKLGDSDGDSNRMKFLPHETSDLEGSYHWEDFEADVFLQANRGQWVRWRWHVKVSEEKSASGPSDGVVEIWKDNTLLYSASDLPIRNDEPDRQDGMDILRLLGWSNSGYDQATSFDVDDLTIHTQNPGW